MARLICIDRTRLPGIRGGVDVHSVVRSKLEIIPNHPRQPNIEIRRLRKSTSNMGKLGPLGDQCSEACSEVRPHPVHKSRFATSENTVNVRRHRSHGMAPISHNIIEAQIVVGNTECQSNFLFAAFVLRQIFVKGIVKCGIQAICGYAESPRAYTAYWILFRRSMNKYIMRGGGSLEGSIFDSQVPDAPFFNAPRDGSCGRDDLRMTLPVGSTSPCCFSGSWKPLTTNRAYTDAVPSATFHVGTHRGSAMVFPIFA